MLPLLEKALTASSLFKTTTNSDMSYIKLTEVSTPSAKENGVTDLLKNLMKYDLRHLFVDRILLLLFQYRTEQTSYRLEGGQ